MLFTADGQLNMQMTSLSCNGVITGGRLFVNIQQRYVNTDGTGCPAFRFRLPERSFMSRMEIRCPEKELKTEYISKEESLRLKEAMPRGMSPLTLDDNGYFAAIIGVVKPKETIDISFTYIQQVSANRSLKICLPLQTKERLSPDFTSAVNVSWHTATGAITASGSHSADVNGNTVTLSEGYIPDKDIILDLRAEESSVCNVYKGKEETLMDIALPFEPLRRQKAYEYLFMIDASANMREHWDNVKNSVLSCICALEEAENFNIIAFGLTPHLLSIGSLKATDSSKASAKTWLDDIRPSGACDIREALSFANDLCTRKTDVFLVTNSPVKSGETLIADVENQKYRSLNIISGVEEDYDVLYSLAHTGGGYAERTVDSREIADGLSKAVNRCILSGLENVRISKNAVWQPDNVGTIYPWDKLQITRDRMASVPEIIEITAISGGEEVHTSAPVNTHTKGAEGIINLYRIESADDEKLVRISKKSDLPTRATDISMRVTTSSEGSSMHFPVCASAGSGSDKPGNPRKNVLALLAMQSTSGSIGSSSETAGRLWEIMTSHPTPSIFLLQIKKGVENLFGFVQSGEYDILPERILDIFELWLEMFPSDSIFAKKLEALVYMNRK